MPRTVSHHVTDEIDPAEREVTNEIEHFVAGRLVGVPKFVVDQAIRPKHEQVFGGEMPANPDGAESECFPFEYKSPAIRNFAGERLGGNLHGVGLTRNIGIGAVIEKVSCHQFVRGIVGGRVHRHGRTTMLNHDRFLNGPNGAPSSLQCVSRIQYSIDKHGGGAIQSRWFRAIDFNDAIIDSKTGQSGQEMLDESHSRLATTQSRASLGTGNPLRPSGNHRVAGAIRTHENDTGVFRCRVQTNLNGCARNQARARDYGRSVECPLVSIAHF